MCGKSILDIPNYQMMELYLWEVCKCFNKDSMNMNSESPQNCFDLSHSMSDNPQLQKEVIFFEQNEGSDC